MSLPSSVTSIGGSAFEGCTALASIELPVVGHVHRRPCLQGAAPRSRPSRCRTASRPSADTSWRGATGVTEIPFPAGLSSASDYRGGALAGSSVRRASFADGLAKVPGSACSGDAALEEVSLPSSVTSIGDSAFEGCTALASISLPDGVKSIGGHAFKGCTALESVELGTNIQKFGSAIFDGTPNVVVLCNYQTAAVVYCIDNGVRFAQSGKTVQDDETHLLDRSKSEYYCDSDSISASGTLPITIKYAVKDNWAGKLSDRKIVAFVPRNTELAEDTIKVDGTLLTGDSSYSYNEDSRKLTIPVSKDEGTVTFSVSVSSQDQLTSYAYLSAVKSGEGSATKENIDVLNDSVRALTINADEKVNADTFDVSGIGPANTAIDLYVNSEKVNTVQSLKNGSWKGTVKLRDPQNYYPYTVEAKTADGSLSAKKTVSYVEDAPSLTSLDMEYNEHNVTKTCNLLDDSGVTPQVYYLPNSKFVFKVGIKNANNVDKVYVTSTRNNVSKSIEATYDEASGLYVTHDYFDPNNTSYVPGAISVDFSEKSNSAAVDENFDVSAFKPLLDEKLQNAPVKVTKQTDIETEATVDLSSVCEGASNIVVKSAYATYDELANSDLSDILEAYGPDAGIKAASYIVPGLDGERYVMNLDFSDPKDVLMVTYDALDAAHKISVVELDLAETSGNFELVQQLLDDSTNLGLASKAAKYAYNMYQINTDYNDLVDTINRSSSITDKATALKKAGELRDDKRVFTTFMAVLPLLVTVAGGPPCVAAGIGLSALIAAMQLSSEVIYGARENQVLGKQNKVRWVIDPSGTVADSTTGEPIADAEMTAYWIPNDDSADFYENKPSLDTYGTKWDALEYQQANPLTTNADGKYRWDVPEGWWRVKCVAKGYEEKWTDWMTVPPVQTEVNIQLDPLPAETADIASAAIEAIPTQYYDGKAKTPELTVTLDGTKLVEGTDYEVAYANNTDPGTATVTLTGKGSYAGTKTATFAIEQPVKVYRLYNKWSGEHLFTTSSDEYDSLAKLGWQQEGVAWQSPTTSTMPVYRLYNPWSGDHHYTASKKEYDELHALGWNQEGVIFYSADAETGAPIYRLFNKWLTQGTHLFTTDEGEYENLGKLGWQQEDIAFYGLKLQ